MTPPNVSKPRRMAAEGTARSMRLRVGETEAFIVGEEIGLAAQNLLRDERSADGAAEAVVVETRVRDTVVIVLPGIGVQVVVEVILVSGAVPLVSAALGLDMTCAPAELLKSAPWPATFTLNSSTLSAGVGITPVAPAATPLLWLPRRPLGRRHSWSYRRSCCRPCRWCFRRHRAGTSSGPRPLRPRCHQG